MVPVGRRGKVGLFNLGNSCYLNSSLQCLSHIKQLTTHFLTGRYAAEVNKENWAGTKGQLVEEYATLMKDLWFRQDKCISPTTFKKLLGRLKPEWAGFGQHDAHEVIGYLLDMLHEDLNRAKAKPFVEKGESDGTDEANDARIASKYNQDLKGRDDSIVRDLVGSMIRNCCTCLNCNKKSVTFEVQTAMTLAIPRSTSRKFRVYLIPWRGGTGDSLLSPLELGVEVDRLATFYAIKKCLIRRLQQVRPKLITPATDMLLAEWSEKHHQAVRYFSPDADDEGIAHLRDGIVLAVFLLPSDVYESLSSRISSTTLISLQQRVISTSPTKIELAGFPVLFPAGQKLTCWKVRFMVWKHVSAYVRPDSELGKLLEGADKQQRVHLDLALASSLPLRMVTVEQTIVPMVCGNALNSADQLQAAMIQAEGELYRETFKRIAAVGLTLSGGLNPSCYKSLGSTLPIDKNIEVTVLLRRGSLSVDWSGVWLEQLDVDALMNRGAVRDETAVLLFGTPKGLGGAGENSGAAAAAAAAGAAGTGMRRRSLSGGESPLSLEQCLRNFTSDEMLEEVESWKCPHCRAAGGTADAEGVALQSKRRLTLMSAQLPEVLVLMLKRFEHRDLSSLLGRPRGGFSHTEKIETFVDFPLEGLDMAPYCDDPHAQRTVYDLFAVCNHYGRMGFGHYTAFARDCTLNGNLSDAWSFYDDNDVKPFSAEDVKSSAAYVLFYLRRP